MEDDIKFRKLGTADEKHAINERRLNNAASLSTDDIRTLAYNIKKSEHSGWSDLEKNMNDEQKHRLSFF